MSKRVELSGYNLNNCCALSVKRDLYTLNLLCVIVSHKFSKEVLGGALTSALAHWPNRFESPAANLDLPLQPAPYTPLDDGATLAVIFCWVKDAQQRPHLVHVSYTPAAGSTPGDNSDAVEGFKREFFPGTMTLNIHPQLHDKRVPFTVIMPDVGTMRLGADAVEYRISCPSSGLEVDLRLTNRVPWSSHDPLYGPMGFISRISALLPLNWHVYSTASVASGTFSHGGKTRQVTGIAHVEKNWGTSFPPGWIWSQSFGSTKDLSAKSLALAGGEALPWVQAYLVGYRSSKVKWDFQPPFTMAIGPLSPFMCIVRDSVSGIVNLTVQTMARKLVIKMSAPCDSFMGFAAPLADGHQPMFAFESFVGRTKVEAWERRWPWQTWKLIEEGEC
ncbi:hypothetical protein BC835DRAFT_1308476, partial [Cytidiella melzeri]